MIQTQRPPTRRIAFPILIALSFSHCFNDLLQSVITAVYPLFKEDLSLSFAQIGLITLVYQMSASVFQPVIGLIFDKRPFPWSLPMGMSFTLVGILNLTFASNLYWLLASVFIVGIGSSVLHPEASRITFLASGGKRGLAQSLFQVGGNLGGSLGPLLVALLVAPYGRRHIALFVIVAIAAILVMLPHLPLVSFVPEPPQEASVAYPERSGTAFVFKDDCIRHFHSADTNLLQVHLYGEPDKLLYILSDT